MLPKKTNILNKIIKIIFSTLSTSISDLNNKIENDNTIEIIIKSKINFAFYFIF